ncbi:MULTISPECIES: ABC transporter substrate-binding protein [unclassified Streptomyces]|jgi:ABC-type branched-subunit amino acid transport system substrate-binding protein|uniref:ABC transporter substrate-binding protein n=1 Tax=unclassified Streptomyces TaxID=2593676 RepID=UPI000F4E3C8B|nr:MULTISPECIES: ABC transporter substrate-binding protein [unclassified Streptomyces]QUC60148.1 ABC transporter substrate-binding protein [Streptomyces sp. A2-16]
MRRFRRAAGTTAVLAAVALTANACAGEDSAGAAGSSSEIHIGAWLPLTGATASYGVPEKAGADAYFKMLNAQGGINGRKVRWTVKDNAADPQQTVQIARELVGQDKVVAIVNANGTSQAEAAFPFVLNQSKVPVLNEVGGTESWYEPPRAGLFGTQTLYEDQAAAIAAWAVQDGAKRILVVHSDPAAFVNVAKQVEPVAKKVDPSVEVNRLAVKYQTTDYTPVISKVKAAKPQAVIVVLTSPEAAAYLKEAKLQGLSLPTYAYAPVAAESTVSLAKDAAEGLKAVQLVKAPSDPDPAVKEFRTAMARYEPGQDAGFLALWGWSNAKVFAEIAKTVKGPVTSQALSTAYQKASSVDPGVSPVMKFSASEHLGTRSVQRVVVKNGVWTSVGDFYTPPARD